MNTPFDQGREKGYLVFKTTATTATATPASTQQLLNFFFFDIGLAR